LRNRRLAPYHHAATTWRLTSGWSGPAAVPLITVELKLRPVAQPEGVRTARSERNVMATGTTPNHLLHLFLSLFTFGLWIPVWILVAVGTIGGYRCTKCGSRV
jgi:hypothetical protein